MKAHFQERSIGNLEVVELPGDPNKGTIVLLHGFGAHAYDLVSLSETCKGPTWIFPQAPLLIPFSQHYTGRAWFPINIELLSLAIKEKRYHEVAQAFPPEISQAQITLENLLNRLDVPRSKIILGGFSQGAILAIETALRSSEKCGGLLIFSGTLINEMHWREKAPLHANTPFFQSHGSHDALLPLQIATMLEKLLIDSGLKGRLHAFSGGHEIPPSILAKLSTFLKELVDW